MEEETNKGKQILLVLISLVFLAVTYFVFSKYVFNSEIPSLSINLVNSENTEANVARIKGKTKNIQFIDSDIFDSSKFKDLTGTDYKRIDVENFKKGKANPFEKKQEEKEEKEEKEDRVEDEQEEVSEVDNLP